MEPHRYYPVPFPTGIWAHWAKQISLCVDDFVVKYFTKDDADHLLKSLKNNDEILTDWEVRNYPRLSLHWNHNEDYVDISIPDYVTKALDRLQHTKPKQPQHAPHLRKRTAHGKSIQMATYTNESDLLEKSPSPLNQL